MTWNTGDAGVEYGTSQKSIVKKCMPLGGNLWNQTASEKHTVHPVLSVLLENLASKKIIPDMMGAKKTTKYRE